MSVLLAIVAATMLLPGAVALILGETGAAVSFLGTAGVSIVLGLAIWFALRKYTFKLTARTSFVAVAFSWIMASILGAVPFVVSGAIPSFTDALFESVSGFTTTGATICSNVEALPRSINLWRMETHWLGGMGIVALTVALLPLIGVGGFQLIKAETTGPEKGKITPKITMTAKILWFIYLGLTILETIALRIAGMDFLDALGHSFSTLGTGGFSSRNSSIGAYNSAAVDVIITVFMFLSGINFSLFFMLLKGKFGEIRENSELRAYIWIVFIAGLVVTFTISPLYDSFADALRYAFFQVVSIITTTGYGTADYTMWPVVPQFVIFLLFGIGGCSGSTGGGVKVVRWVIMGKQARIEAKKMLHPHGVFDIRLNRTSCRKDVVFSVAGFLWVYLILVIITTFVAAFDTQDLFSALTTGLTVVGNVGPGFGAIGPANNFGLFSSLPKYWFCFAMIAGRLELYTMIMFFFPDFWKN
ncbi:MAG: TrkH family potassium uptake protein [Treponema sp.]|nr:TrkH family potassium uptake protein [Candidatus Treponema caballi]